MYDVMMLRCKWAGDVVQLGRRTSESVHAQVSWLCAHGSQRWPMVMAWNAVQCTELEISIHLPVWQVFSAVFSCSRWREL